MKGRKTKKVTGNDVVQYFTIIIVDTSNNHYTLHPHNMTLVSDIQWHNSDREILGDSVSFRV